MSHDQKARRVARRRWDDRHSLSPTQTARVALAVLIAIAVMGVIALLVLT